MSVTKFLRLAFAASACLYGLVALLVLGAPDWPAPLLPQGAGARVLYLVFLPLTLAVWAFGFTFGRRAEAPASLTRPGSASPWPRLRLIMGCAFLESGAIFGLVLAFVSGDVRPALASSAVTAVLILLLPAEKNAIPGP